MKRLFEIGCITGVLAAMASGAGASEQRGHGAHVHEHGQLNLVLEGSRLNAELIVPGMDVVGFEHAPRDERQEAAVDAAVTTLKDPDKIFALPAQAGCEVESVDVESAMLGDEHEDHAEEHKDEDTHAEFHLTYSFRCSDPSSLDEFAMRYFEHFKGTAELEVQAVGPWGQTAGELTPASPRMRF
jgi:hypothetical protein